MSLANWGNPNSRVTRRHLAPSQRWRGLSGMGFEAAVRFRVGQVRSTHLGLCGQARASQQGPQRKPFTIRSIKDGAALNPVFRSTAPRTSTRPVQSYVPSSLRFQLRVMGRVSRRKCRSVLIYLGIYIRYFVLEPGLKGENRKSFACGCQAFFITYVQLFESMAPSDESNEGRPL